MLLAVGSDKILHYYESKPQAIAFFRDNTTLEDVEAIKSALAETGKVTETKFVSKEEALQIYKERNKSNPTLLELVTANILPSSLEISATTPNELVDIAEILKREPVVEEVVFPEDVIQSLTKATTIIRSTGMVAITFLVVFAFLVILMVVGFKIRIKRTEIETMKLLGASTWFIRVPFLLEGITYGLIGALSAWIASYAIMWYISPFVDPALGEIKLFPVSPLLMLAILGIALGVATLIGGLGSYGAVRRYLRL